MRKIDGCSIQMAVSQEVVKANVDRSSKRGFPLVTDCGDWREGMPLAIVGSGPSVKGEIANLKRFKHVMAAGSSHDWLVEQGIALTWAVVCDPDPVMANYVRRPIKGCKYLVSSMCDEAVFEALEGQQIYLWDSGGSREENVIYDGRDAVMVGGGATVGTRAMVLALLFGFWNLHLFGFDTCIWPDGHHCFGEFSDPAEKMTEITRVRLGDLEGREFVMAGYMLAQLFDIKTMLKMLGSRMRLTVHGDGAIAELMKIGKQGDCYETS